MPQREINWNNPIILELQKEQKTLAEKYAQLASDFSIQLNRSSHFKEKISELEALGQATERKIDRILGYMENDDSTGVKGLVYEVRKNTEFRSSSLSQIKMISVVVSALIAIGVTVFQKVFIK